MRKILSGIMVAATMAVSSMVYAHQASDTYSGITTGLSLNTTYRTAGTDKMDLITRTADYDTVAKTDPVPAGAIIMPATFIRPLFTETTRYTYLKTSLPAIRVACVTDKTDSPPDPVFSIPISI